MAKKNILLLAGDGIGPEIMEEAKNAGVFHIHCWGHGHAGQVQA